MTDRDRDRMVWPLMIMAVACLVLIAWELVGVINA